MNMAIAHSWGVCLEIMLQQDAAWWISKSTKLLHLFLTLYFYSLQFFLLPVVVTLEK